MCQFLLNFHWIVTFFFHDFGSILYIFESFLWYFRLIFLVILSKQTRLLQSIDQCRIRGGGRTSTKSVLGSWKTKKTIFSHVRYLFLFYFIYLSPLPLQNVKFIYSAWYLPKSPKFGQSAQFGGGLDIYWWGWTWVKIQLRPNLGEGVLRG